MRVPIAILIFFILGITSLTPIRAQNSGDAEVEVSFEEILVIGNGPDAPPESTFGRPRFVEVDQDGRIYVADQMSVTIKVFASDGTYLNSLGRKGKGPGEFMEIVQMGMTEEGHLVILDVPMFRATIMKTNGEVLGTYNTSRKTQAVNFINQIKPYQNGFLTLFKQWGFGSYAQFNRDDLFVEWDSTFENETNAFGSFDALGFEEGFGRRFIRSRVGSFVLWDNTILMAPYLYSGRIEHYQQSSEGWKREDPLRGHTFEDPSFKEVDEQQGGEITHHSAGQETVHGMVFRKSEGIYLHGEDYIVNFISERRAGEVGAKLSVEVFDRDLRFLGYHELFRDDELFSMHRLVQASDGKGRFYLVQRRDDVPVVRVLALDITE